MIVYRISNAEYSDDISGTGAKLYGARWNSKGIPLLYTGEHISLVILEMLVNTHFKDYDIALTLLYIQLPIQANITEIKIDKLKSNWKDDLNFTRFIGDEFAKQNRSLLLKVPSVVVDQEHNYLINPLHPDFKKLKIVTTRSFWPDKRLFTI